MKPDNDAGLSSHTFKFNAWVRKASPLDLLGIIGFLGAVIFCLLGFLAPMISTHSPYEIHLVTEPLSPGNGHFFGTDQLGRDIFSRTLYALRHSIHLTILASFSTVLAGVVLGGTAGYFGGVFEWLMVGLIDCILAFPSLLLTIGICATLGPGTQTIFLSLVITGWASVARIMRSRVHVIKTKEFLTASRLLGAGHAHILLRHVLPHCLPLAFVLFILNLGTTFLAESSLSFLGFGLPPPLPTLGKLIYDGARYFRIAPWWSFFPGLIMMWGILSFNLLGDGLRRRMKL
jgi:peptide/nickel transport system permease protein